MRRRARGQAVVELALGALVFVTIVTFGIYFAEVGFLTLKVQESASSALWDLTGRPLHDYRAMDNTNKRNGAIADVESASNARYKGYKGYGPGGGSGITQAMAKATPVQVTCEADSAIADWSDVDTDAVLGNKKIFTAGGLQASSGVRCAAEGSIEAWNVPKSFLEKGKHGYFKAKNWEAEGGAAGGILKVCALGRAKGGACPASFQMLVDDWGLQGTDESGLCALESGESCNNKGYKNLVRQVYDASFPGLQPAQKLAETIAGAAPIDPGIFWFSYSPTESGWVDPNYPAGEGPSDWHTGTGAGSRHQGYADAYASRFDFWLGMKDKWKPQRQ
jgi:hypothetical protein